MPVVGIFGGTFDPIHFGHLNYALEVYEKQKLDEIWFIPAYSSPFKIEKKTTDPHHRLNMVELAISDIPYFKALDIEVNRGGVSYTVDTIKQLVEQNPSTQFRLLISSETEKDFLKWRDPDEIIRLAPLIVGTRGCDREVNDGRIQVRNMDISSTEIRKRIASGLYCGHLVPKKVLDYIYKNRLYCGA